MPRKLISALVLTVAAIAVLAAQQTTNIDALRLPSWADVTATDGNPIPPAQQCSGTPTANTLCWGDGTWRPIGFGLTTWADVAISNPTDMICPNDDAVNTESAGIALPVLVISDQPRIEYTLAGVYGGGTALGQIIIIEIEARELNGAITLLARRTFSNTDPNLPITITGTSGAFAAGPVAVHVTSFALRGALVCRSGSMYRRVA